MDYKEKYEMALEGIKEILGSGEDSIKMSRLQLRLQGIFPELKESEDERIREDIISCLKYSGIKPDRPINPHVRTTMKDAIAWLEKQGTPAKLSEEEQNKFAKGVLTSCALSFIDYLDAHKHEGKMCVSNGECKDIENAFHNAMWDRLHRYYCKYIEKQGEQKLPIEKLSSEMKTVGESLGFTNQEECNRYNQMVTDLIMSDDDNGKQKPAELPKGEDYGIDGLYHAIRILEETLGKVDGYQSDDGILEHKCAISAVKELSKQKPAWSEEDERLRKEIVNYLECQKEEEPTRKDKINSWISWILKHSFSEWTKEEKEAWNKRLDCIIDILDWAEEKGRISLSDCQDYSIMLKSLRPQNHWKPSDEQIAALEHFVRSIGESGYASPYDNATKLLYSLLADLKKLREE